MSAKQAINNKLQGSVATYLRCGGVVNNQIKKGLLLSLRVNKNLKLVNIWQNLQARAWLSRALCTPGQHTAKSAGDNCAFRKRPRTVRYIIAVQPNAVTQYAQLPRVIDVCR